MSREYSYDGMKFTCTDMQESTMFQNIITTHTGKDTHTHTPFHSGQQLGLEGSYVFDSPRGKPNLYSFFQLFSGKWIPHHVHRGDSSMCPVPPPGWNICFNSTLWDMTNVREQDSWRGRTREGGGERERDSHLLPIPPLRSPQAWGVYRMLMGVCVCVCVCVFSLTAVSVCWPVSAECPFCLRRTLRVYVCVCECVWEICGCLQ